MSIVAEDWDELDDARRRRDQRKKNERAPAAQPAAKAPAPRPAFKAPRTFAAARTTDATPVTTWDALEPVPVREPEPERILGLAQFEDDDYGEPTENLRVPAGIAGANLLVWLVGLFGGVVELVGVAFFVSVGMLLAAYLTREAQRDRTALICLAGAVPLPMTIIGLFF